MKIVILYYKDREEFWQNAALFVIGKPDNIDEFAFVECLKESLKLYASIEHLSSNTTEENLKQYAKMFLNNIKTGKSDFWINDFVYLECENIKTI